MKRYLQRCRLNILVSRCSRNACILNKNSLAAKSAKPIRAAMAKIFDKQVEILVFLAMKISATQIFAIKH